MAKKQPNIVAELGRPETPGETATRKAENSRLYRQRKTVNNLVFSLLVTVGVVFVIYLMVPRGVGDFEDRSVDVAQLAEQSGADRPLVVPDVPETWKAKQATLTAEDDGINFWQIHYTTEHGSYATVVQAYRTDGTPVAAEWIAEKLEGQDPTGTDQLGGIDWTVYDHPERRADHVNMRFGLTGESQDSTLLVYGTDDGGTIRVLATQVADSIAGGESSGTEGAQ